MIFKNQRNPILPLEHHVPDSEAHVMPDGKLYIYGSYDLLDDVYCSGEYHVVSTADMKTWEIADTPSFRAEQVPWYGDPDAVKYPGIDWSHPTPFIRKMLEEHAEDKANFESMDDTPKPPLLFAPDCIYQDGTYYLYFCLQDDSEGIATAKNPAGPFADPVQLPCGGIDPAIFVDQDGTAYYYWGQLFSHGVKLGADMRSFDRREIVDDLVTEENHFFHEGSSLRRIGDTYYYLYADMERGKPTALGYSTSDAPLGPFTYRGIIIDNAPCDPASWNNHGSIECFQGQWYVFYHRCSRGKQQYRRLCIEKITVLPDGTIPEVKMTSQGVGEPFAPGETIYGYQACEVHGGCYIDVDEQFGEALTGITDGSRAVFRYIRSDQPWSRIAVCAGGSGNMIIHLISKDGEMQQTAEMSIHAESSDGAGKCAARMKDDPESHGKQVAAQSIYPEAEPIVAYHTQEMSLSVPSGEYELQLEFSHSRGLKIGSVILW